MTSERLSRREFLRIGTVAAAGGVLAACAPSTPEAIREEEPAPTKAPTAEPVVLEWWRWGGGTEERRRWTEEHFYDTFNAYYDNIHINVIWIESSDALRTALQAGAGPDIFISPATTMTAEMVFAGHILDITDYADEFGWKEKLLDWAYAAGTLEGKLYCLPTTYETLFVYYNKTLFDKQGWKIPTDRAEMEALADAALADDIWPFAYLSCGGDCTQHLLGLSLDAYAGADNHYKALIGEKSWTDEEIVGAMELLAGWFEKGYVSGSTETYFALEYGDLAPALAKGDAAMLASGTWNFDGLSAQFEETGQEYDWFIMPSLREGVRPVYPLGIGSAAMASSETEYPHEAALGLDWHIKDKERMIEIAAYNNFGQWNVPMKITADDLPSDTDPLVSRYLADFAKVTGAGDYGYTTYTFYPAAAMSFSGKGFDEVLTGARSVEQYLTELDDLFHEAWEAGTAPPVPDR